MLKNALTDEQLCSKTYFLVFAYSSKHKYTPLLSNFARFVVMACLAICICDAALTGDEKGGKKREQET